ncbi:MAG: sulfatase [Kiritimatiellales bacterium]
MRAIMVMFDSLNRHMLPPYGCDWVHAPNFQRLAERTVAFETSFVGSMPCMPARREIHTGRYNFLHRSWGPLEPFDDSMPEILKRAGIYSHLCSDHAHYWEEGGANYHTKYSTWEIARGQEGDPWIADLSGAVKPPENLHPNQGVELGSPKEHVAQDWINRQFINNREEYYPQNVVFHQGLRFLETNREADNWFLQIETFDPHEPYQVPERFKKLYDDDYTGPFYDWPPYAPATEDEETIRHMRKTNAALISMCDESLGRVLDFMDTHDMWNDTMLIVNTDHGFLLGEHDCWAKCWAPFYNEIARTPLFIWDPRSGISGERRTSLVQTIDLAPTLLDFFNLPVPPDMQGRPLRGVIENDTPVREAGLFGMNGGHINVTDGRYVYMRAPEAGKPNAPICQYTLMPAHMREPFTLEELRTAEMAPPLSFSKECPVMKISSDRWKCRHNFRTMLFDIKADPQQQHELNDPALEQRMIDLLIQCMQSSAAPPEQYLRMGLE